MMYLIFSLTVSLFAQSAPPSSPRVGVSVSQTKLSLQDAIARALKSNLDIEIERTNTASTRAAVRGALGYLDLGFRWLPSLESRDTPTGSILAGAGGKIAERFFGQNFYLRQRLPWHGVSLHADFENMRTTTNNPFVSLNPYINSRLVIGAMIPLMRDRATDRERTELRVRRKQVDISDTDLELRVIDVVTRVQSAYWDLVAARQDAEVKLDSVNWAKEQLARTERQIQNGVVAPVELSAAEAELERRSDTYLAAVGAVTEAENALKTLIAGSREDSIWSDQIIPTVDHPVTPPNIDDLRPAVQQALSKRAELRSLSSRKEANDIQKQYAVNQTKPQMNLVAGYGNSGLAGSVLATENPFAASQQVTAARLNQLSALAGLPPLPAVTFGGSVPPSLVGGYGSTLSNLFSFNYPTAQVGLQFDWTMKNRTAEANLQQSVITERRLQLERARTEQLIEAQVRNAMQALQTARQRIAAAEASARAAKEKLDSEVRLFQTGESTNFFVLTRQNEYADSLRRVVVANLDFNRAVARYEQALGATLETHNIELR